MASSFIYKSSWLYEFVMLLLYGRHYNSRYRSIAELIPNYSTALDLCCGPALLYHRYLRKKGVRYTGVDINTKFIEQLIRAGGAGKVSDLRIELELPAADYVIMQASLYHFLPDPSRIIQLMLDAARKQVIIAEPVRNFATSASPFIASLGRFFTNPGSGEQPNRFNEQTLSTFFDQFSTLLVRSFPIAGGREVVYVFNGSSERSTINASASYEHPD